MTAGDYPRSWYQATANAHAPYPALEGDIDCDVAVVGGGYTGLSAALELAGRGYAVAVLEAHRVGWGASGRNGGHIVTGYNLAMSDIARMVGQADAHRLWDMAKRPRRSCAGMWRGTPSPATCAGDTSRPR
jgi:gamma-glutamylputrescine oxidase